MAKITDTFECIPRDEKSILRFQMLRSDVEARRDVIALIEEKIRRQLDELVNDVIEDRFPMGGEEFVKSNSLRSLFKTPIGPLCGGIKYFGVKRFS